MKIEVVKADITKLDVDAIVNAAKETLLGGGGVDGAIHKAAGPKLLEECKTLNGCRTGEAKITNGYRLLARFVIHTVGPIYGFCNGKEAELLHGCYYNSLNLADQHQLKSIAFPGISTGVYGYPKPEAASVAHAAINDFFDSHQESSIEDVKLVAYSNQDLESLQAEFEKP